MEDSRFNPDELAVQDLAGGGPRGGSGIRSYVLEQHRQFFAQLPYLFVGAIDAAGWPIATQLAGRPGFVQSPDPVTLHITALPNARDPAAEAFALDREIAILGIDFSTRRRIRANGRIISREAGGIRVAVSQSFGNCPQYIQSRSVASAEGSPEVPSNPLETLVQLDEAARTDIERADTFFVASRSPDRERRSFRRRYLASRRPPRFRSCRRRRIDDSRLSRQPLLQHAWQSQR